MSKFKGMNLPNMEEMRKRIKDRNQRSEKFKSVVDKNFYPFWDMEEGEQAIVRLLPDINPENGLGFCLPKFNHQLSIDGKNRKIVCPKTFESIADCPICDLSQKYYRENDEEKGLYYWRKIDYMIRLLILENPIKTKDEEGKEIDYVGRVCTTTFRKKIIKAIEENLKEFPKADPVPWSLDSGRNFLIKKAKLSGDYPEYTLSRFVSEMSPIPEEYEDVVESELIDFKTLLPKPVDLDKVQNFLDAHLGVADFNYGPKQASGDDDDDDDDDGKSNATVKESVKEKSEANSTETSSSKVDENVTELSSSTDDDDDDKKTRDMIANILNRSKG